MNTELINYFNAAVIDDGSHKIPFDIINAKAVRLGWIIRQEVCNETVDKWLDTLVCNYNSTFYKEWDDVISKNRFELFVDQIMHYASTYGTDYTGDTYIPNDGYVSPSFKSLKVLGGITSSEMVAKCLDLIKTNVALNSRTVNALCSFIREYKGSHGLDINVNDIGCKEAQAVLCAMIGIYPTDPFALLRCLVYGFTGKSSLIKDRNTIRAIKCNTHISVLKSLTDKQLVALSTIFYRFKPLILAMKDEDTASIINKIRRLAVKNHRPFHVGFWENVISTVHTDEEIDKRLPEIDNFKKIRLLQGINVALAGDTDRAYNIRNGKMYVRLGYYPKYDVDYLMTLRTKIEDSLIKSLSTKKCTVKFPKNIDITLPSTEKSFVGNYPMGSSIDLTKNTIVGIYWRNEWGTHDFDLSMTDYAGRMISWRCDYYDENKDVVFSGDMTNADPEATELLYMSRRCPDGMIRVNQFNGEPKSQFRFFIATEEIENRLKKNYMVDPNNIKFETMIDVDSQREKIVGLINRGKFMFMDVHSGNGIYGTAQKYHTKYIDLMCEYTSMMPRLRDILLQAGFTETDENPDIDFSLLDKDTIINLLK